VPFWASGHHSGTYFKYIIVKRKSIVAYLISDLTEAEVSAPLNM
jgi:hypothetical protein